SRRRRTRPPTTLFPYTTLFRSVAELPLPAAVPSPQLQLYVAEDWAVEPLASKLHARFEQVGAKLATGAGGGGGACCSRRNLMGRSEEHTSELQSRFDLVCRLLL